MTIPQFQKTILSWYKNHRRDLPWRRTRDPCKILVSEVMLQQTQVSRVLPKYKEFLKTFPTLQVLAKAPNKKLLKVWAGLGYWKRALLLKETAQLLMRGAKATNSQTSPRRRFGTVLAKRDKSPRAQSPKSGRDFEARLFRISLPSDPKILETLPGIGHYTARALSCFAFGNAEAFLDTNIRRVYLHFFFPERQNVSDSEILPIAQKAVDALPKSASPREWHYALFDYGATVLKDKKINKQSKHYRRQSRFEGSFRSFRTKVVQFLLLQPKSKITQKTIESFLRRELAKQKSRHAINEIIGSLLKDNLIKKSSQHYFL